MAFSMTDDELKTRIKNGTPIKVLAELNGVSDQSIYNWMKKNDIQRPDKKDKPEKKPEKKSAGNVASRKVLEKIQNDITLLEETIKSLENALEEHRKELEIWKELEDCVK